MKKGLKNRRNFHFKRITGTLAVLVCPLSLNAGSSAPQDSIIDVPELSLTPQTGDGSSFGQPVFQTVAGTDLIYYEFNDSTNARRGIRAKDLEGNLVYEVLETDSIYNFAVAGDGTIYVFQKTGDNYFIYVYELSGPPPGTYAQTDVWGTGGTGDTNSWSSSLANYARIGVSPVSGKVFVKESVLINHVDTDGELQVFDASGTPQAPVQINGIVASTLEGDIRDFFLVPGHDGTGEVWVRGNYGSSWGTRSQWLKVFDEAGNFLRLFDVTSSSYVKVIDDFIYTPSNTIVPITADNYHDYTGVYKGSVFDLEDIFGRDSLGRFVYYHNDSNIRVYEGRVFRTFDPRDQNAVPNVVVSRIEQRSGTTILDIDYRVEDSDSATATTAALALPDGTQTVLNALPLVTFADGTETNLGTSISTGTRYRLSWNAGSDWNVDFGDISVLVLARDDRPNLFDVHLVQIPADGDRPAVTISRNPLEEYDFTMQWLWLIATNDDRISFTGGIISGTPAAGVAYDGQQLTDGSGNSTDLGRAFLLGLDGYRAATTAELIRAREGATEGFTIELDPPKRIYTVARPYSLPRKINEYGIESEGWVGSSTYDYRPESTTTQLVHVVPLP